MGEIFLCAKVNIVHFPYAMLPLQMWNDSRYILVKLLTCLHCKLLIHPPGPEHTAQPTISTASKHQQHRPAQRERHVPH